MKDPVERAQEAQAKAKQRAAEAAEAYLDGGGDRALERFLEADARARGLERLIDTLRKEKARRKSERLGPSRRYTPSSERKSVSEEREEMEREFRERQAERSERVGRFKAAIGREPFDGDELKRWEEAQENDTDNEK